MLRPVPHVDAAALAHGQRMLVLDTVWASVTGALSGGVILAAFALALGATPLEVGLLAAIPFLTQAAQLPATLMIERWRMRRRMAVLTITGARVLIGASAAVVLLPSPQPALAALIALQVVIATLHAVGGCAVNTWLHQLIPREALGRFFSRRMVWGTAVACIATLAAGAWVDRGPMAGTVQAYAVALVAAALAGLASSVYLARAPEPQMHDAGPAVRTGERLLAPFRDRNYRRLLVFLGAWTVASNVAAPFLTVYLIQQRGYAVATVTGLWVASQVASAATLFWWGRLSDRLSNKAVLAVVLPLYFASTLALVFVDAVDDARWQLALLGLVHVAMGVATGGIGLASGNLGLKLAPQGQGAAYLASTGLVVAVAGGVAPIAGGAIAQALQASELSALVRWVAPGQREEVALVSFAHWEFVFALSAAAGLYVLHALSRIAEGEEVSERLVMQEFALEAWRSVQQLGSVGGALGGVFQFDRLTERRLWWRAGRHGRPVPQPRLARRRPRGP